VDSLERWLEIVNPRALGSQPSGLRGNTGFVGAVVGQRLLPCLPDLQLRDPWVNSVGN
jgi:hypothetical protein